METITDYWKSFVEFLSVYKTEKISEVIRSLDWQEVIRNPVVWVVTLSLLGVVVWKRQFKILVLVASVVVFVVLLQFTLPPAGQSIPLESLLKFVGGTMLLLAVNVYFLIIRN